MKSIRTKLWSGMMMLIVIIIFLLWLFQIIFLEKFYTVLEVNHITGKAGKIVKEMEGLKNIEEVNTSMTLINKIDELVYEKQLTIEIFDASNSIVYQESTGNNTGIPGSMKVVAAQVIQKALNGTVNQQQMTHPKFGYQFMIIGLPIYYEAGVKGAMLITMPMASVDDTADILKKQLIIITGILLLVSVIISFRLSKRFANPIQRISKQAESYTAGQFAVRIEDIGNDEIGQLAKRMNQMGDTLIQNEVLQKEIIANVSHEIRTPLALIRGYAETIRDVTGDNPEKRRKQLNIIVEESERLNNIVEDILNLSQLQSGALSIEIEPFSLYEMLLKIREHYQLQDASRTFHMHGVVELSEDVVGDKKKLEHVFRNLIDNAFRHTKENELVEVVVIQKVNRINVAIIDHGEGIAQEDLEHIFERYYRGNRADGKKGTGLGLAIVKSILELHQLSFGVESEPGKGTTFWFELEKGNSHTSF